MFQKCVILLEYASFWQISNSRQVGGSDFSKQQEQLGSSTVSVTSLFDFCFSENGLNAYRLGKPLASTSFIQWLGEEKYQNMVNFLLKYLSEVRLPKKRGTFIEFRSGMINVSPIGRNASVQERNEFEEYVSFFALCWAEHKYWSSSRYDKIHNIRSTLVEALKKEFPDYGLTWVLLCASSKLLFVFPPLLRGAVKLTLYLPGRYSIGGQISFDVFPTGWDKTYCLRHIEAEKDISGVEYKDIHFFGDKCFPGGNDYEIYSDPRTIGHSVTDPDDTMKQLKELFQLWQAE